MPFDPSGAPDMAGGGASGPGAPDAGGGGGLLDALRAQQQGPDPSAPGSGTQAQAIMLMQNAIAMLTQALGGLQVGTPMHRDANRAIGTLSRHLSQGQPTAGVQQTQLGDLLRMVAKSAILQQLGGQQGGDQGGGDDGGGGGPPGGQPMMPSTPIPGA